MRLLDYDTPIAGWPWSWSRRNIHRSSHYNRRGAAYALRASKAEDLRV
jgi:hypothetical protein